MIVIVPQFPNRNNYDRSLTSVRSGDAAGAAAEGASRGGGTAAGAAEEGTSDDDGDGDG